jgi:hypothetical protein
MTLCAFLTNGRCSESVFALRACKSEDGHGRSWSFAGPRKTGRRIQDSQQIPRQELHGPAHGASQAKCETANPSTIFLICRANFFFGFAKPVIVPCLRYRQTGRNIPALRQHILAFASTCHHLWCDGDLASPGNPPAYRCLARRKHTSVITFASPTQIPVQSAHSWPEHSLLASPTVSRPRSPTKPAACIRASGLS